MSRYYIEERNEGFGAFKVPSWLKSDAEKKSDAKKSTDKIKAKNEELALIAEEHNVIVALQKETDINRRAALEEELRLVNKARQEAQWEADIQAQIDTENAAADAVADQMYGPTTVGSQECSPGLVWDAGAGLCVREGGCRKRRRNV
jgi:hypothetical protein